MTTQLKTEPANKSTKHITKPTCTFCRKITDVVSRKVVGKKEYLRLSCGHGLVQNILEQFDIESKQPDKRTPFQIFLDDEFCTEDGKHLFKFQKEGVKFGIDSNARCLIADEMGLGKSIQALAIYKWWCKQYNNGKPAPVLLVVKAALLTQWGKECVNWLGDDWLVNIMSNARVQKPWPKVTPINIISYESLYRTDWHKDPQFMSQFKFIIVDEVQQIKNKEAKRTDGVRNATLNVPHIVALSGTPIKNNAEEYFSILNILKPERFNDHSNFVWNYVAVEYTEGGSARYGGIEPSQIRKFQEDTKDFIIRRTEKDVDVDLPPVFRKYSYSDLGDVVKDAYVAKMKQFMAEYAGAMNANILQYLNDMRHLTGYAKVDPTVDEIAELLLTTNKKIAIFTHHHDVAELYKRKLNTILEEGGFAPVIYAVNVDGDKSQYVDEFRKPENRIFIGTTLACGEGLNIQFCDKCYVCEREWNPANEEQVEKRFSRIGATHNKVDATYPTAVGTIDEFFMNLIEKKRARMASALDGQYIKWNESDVLKELADVLSQKGLDAWGF